MKNLKFEQGEEVLVDGKKEIIEVAKKNFSTKKISYKLKGAGRIVAEADIKKLEGKNTIKKAPLFKRYEELYDKPVPNNKKNDEAWIKDKISKAEGEQEELKQLHEQYEEIFEMEIPEEYSEDVDWIKEEIRKVTNPTDAEKYAALKEFDFDELKEVIEEKELDIDADDYESEEELLTAICEELEIEIPEEED